MPVPPKVSDNLKSLLNEAIARAGEEKDTVTADMFHEILAQEEEHHDTFTKLFKDL